MTDYNDGNWHAHNGGECPVHPRSRGDLLYSGGEAYSDAPLGLYMWDEPLLFRVTKPYVEPKKPREVWLLIEDGYITDATFDGTDALRHEYVRAVIDD